MVGFLDLQNSYNPYLFLQDCLPLLEQNQNRICVVGGSLFYVTSVLHGLPESAPIPDKIKDDLFKKYKNFGLETLLLDLFQKDPACYQSIDKSNPRRVLRALEFIEATGTKFSLFKEKKKKKFQGNCVVINPFLPRKILYERINKRVIEMFDLGWETEVSTLHKNDLLNCPIPAIGYSQVLQRILGKISFNDCVQSIQQKTRNFAKRQITWMKKMPGIIHWIDKKNIKLSKLIDKEDSWIHSQQNFTPELYSSNILQNSYSFRWHCTKDELENFLSR